MIKGDYITRWTELEAFALPNIEARTVAEVYVFEFMVHTDQSTQVEGKLFQEMCSLFRIDKTRVMDTNSEGLGYLLTFELLFMIALDLVPV